MRLLRVTFSSSVVRMKLPVLRGAPGCTAIVSGCSWAMANIRAMVPVAKGGGVAAAMLLNGAAVAAAGSALGPAPLAWRGAIIAAAVDGAVVVGAGCALGPAPPAVGAPRTGVPNATKPCGMAWAGTGCASVVGARAGCLRCALDAEPIGRLRCAPAVGACCG